MQNAKIDNYLKLLLNQPLLAIGRASNMLWVGFGKEIECTNFRGQKVKKSSIALHVQSSWRIIDTKRKEIIVAQSDFYFPNRLLKEMVEFNWDVQGNNLFDEKSSNWFKRTSGIYISNYKINTWGDLLLIFSNSDALEVLINSSDDAECWRLFECNSDKPHLAVTGKGVGFE